MLPTLELYFVTERTEMGLSVEDGMGIIVEESVEGLPLVAAAVFREPSDERGGTLVTLKIAYQLPRRFLGLIVMWGLEAYTPDGCEHGGPVAPDSNHAPSIVPTGHIYTAGKCTNALPVSSSSQSSHHRWMKISCCRWFAEFQGVRYK